MTLPSEAAEPSAAESPHGEVQDARRAIGFGVTITLVLSVGGLAGIPRARGIVFELYSLFFTQFGRIELWPLVLVAATALVGYVLMRTVDPADAAADLAPSESPYRPWIIALIAFVAVAIAYAGVHWLFRGFILSDDEYSGWFQALIFAEGKTQGVIPAAWCPYAAAITPTTIIAHADCTWQLSYLPLHSLIQAPFIALGVARLGVPLSAGLSVLLVASIARHLWPDRPSRAYLAAIFLATSTQLLVMSMTVFAMSSHLLLTLLFIRFYIDRRRPAQLAVPWIGVLALGVHSPIPHALFMPPFVLRYLRERRWMMFAYVSIVYVLGVAVWTVYLSHVSRGAVATQAGLTAPAVAGKAIGLMASLAPLFHLPGGLPAYVMTLQLSLVPSWNNLALVTLAVAAMMAWRRLDVVLRDATIAILLTLAVRTLMGNIMGEGWGYRMMYAHLGSLALLAAVGADQLFKAAGARRGRLMLVVASAAALVVQLPMRWVGVNSIVGPYRDGYAWMSTLPVDVVLYPAGSVAWGRQLVRNDPFGRSRPVIVNYSQLSPAQIDSLEASKQTIRTLNRPELRARGFPRGLLMYGGLIIEP